MSEVRQLWIPGPAGRLQALLRVANCPEAGAVVAHPHPLHGGTMRNPVVFHVERALHRLGWTTLRFNFRGVEESDGAYDQGLGEVDDVAASTAWLRGLLSGKPLYLVGYSFGSLCSLKFLQEHPHHGIAGMVAIGLPVREYDLGAPQTISAPIGVVQGSEDEFGSPEEVRHALGNTREKAVVQAVPGASHLFPGRAGEAATAVVHVIGQIGAPIPEQT
jgi:alpha/beta superfamily hydrolase